jgi:hypothetical protein
LKRPCHRSNRSPSSGGKIRRDNTKTRSTGLNIASPHRSCGKAACRGDRSSVLGEIGRYWQRRPERLGSC